MANPAIKNGFFPIANELAEEMAKRNIPGQEMRIIWVLWRKTWGFVSGDRRKDWDWISITQFEKLTGMKRGNVCKSVKSLVVKRLLLHKENTYKFNQNYGEWVVVTRLPPVVKRLLPSSQTTTRGSSQTTTRGSSQLTTHKRNSTKETNTKENNTKEISSELRSQRNKEISEVIFSFKEMNPSVNKLYGNKTQRLAANNLIETHGLEEVIRVVKELLPIINGDKYSKGKSITPLQLEDNWGWVMAYNNQCAKNRRGVAIAI